MASTLNISTTTLRNIVNREFRVSINTKSRKREVVDARSVYFSICYHNLNMTLTSIGKTLGKDHATVLWAVKKADQMYEYDKIYRQKYDDVFKAAIEAGSKNGKISPSRLNKSMLMSDAYIKELVGKVEKLENENKNLKNRIEGGNTHKHILGGIDIPNEYVDEVRDRIKLFIQ